MDSKFENLDPKRPWRWDNWKKASAKDRIWILLISSELFWIMFLISLIASIALAIILGNHWISQAGWRHGLENTSAEPLKLFVFEVDQVR